ncbi:MAG: hypothetical protein ACM359_00220 [Bacillota bacterium]
MSQEERHIGEAGQESGEAALGLGEQRRWPRVDCQRELMIHVVKDGMLGEAISVRSHDFSTMGLGMMHDRPMEVGTQVLVPLMTRSGMPLPLLYTVVYCDGAGEGQWRIGAELVSVFNLDEYVRGRLPHESLAEYICDAVCGDAEDGVE